jgi:hypothetical protein
MKFFLKNSLKNPRGYLTLLALVFGAIFLTVIGGLCGMLLTQNYSQNVNNARAQSFTIAEAGLEYSRWYYAHFPTSVQGSGHTYGPITTTYNDPVTGNPAGTYTESFTGNVSCGQVVSVDMTSTGQVLNGPPGSTIKLVARDALPSVGLYSYILNSSVWAGSDRVVNGPYHSNGGIRMDGTVNAPVTSSLSSWSCTSTFGCSPTTNEPGVFGTGPNQNFWTYPSPQIDFAAIAANFSTLKSSAQSSGLYLPRVSSGTSGASAGRGYHLIFNSNGTVTVYEVTNETDVPSLPVDNSSITTPEADYTLIQSQNLYSSTKTPSGVYTIPASCGLIFVEDNVWIEGSIPSKVTVVAANVTTSGITPDIMLPNNITYSNPSTISGLTAISANDILITPNSPQTMTLDGIFIAQGGAFGRNYYGENAEGYVTCPNSYEPRTSLTIVGTTVSNDRTGTKWLNGCSNGDAGYQTRTDNLDQPLSTNPPPFTPDVSTVGQFVQWRETQ